MADTEYGENRRVWRLANMSPTARKCLDGEKYRLVLETDDVTTEAIQQELFLCLIEDLKTIGIQPTSDPASVYGNLIDLDNCLDVLEWILPNTSYTAIRSDATLQDLISNALSGGVSNDPFLYTYLDIFGGHGEKPGYKPDLHTGASILRDVFTSTGIFVDYMSNLMAKIDDENLQCAEEVNGLDYLEIIRTRSEALVNALSAMSSVFSQESTEFYDALYMRINVGRQYIMAAGRINIAGWIFTTREKSLAEDCRGFYRRKRREFFGGWKLSAAYFQKRGLDIGKIDLAGIMCMYFATCGADVHELNDLAARLRPLLDPSLTQLMDDILSALVDHLEELYSAVRAEHV